MVYNKNYRNYSKYKLFLFYLTDLKRKTTKTNSKKKIIYFNTGENSNSKNVQYFINIHLIKINRKNLIDTLRVAKINFKVPVIKYNFILLNGITFSLTYLSSSIT